MAITINGTSGISGVDGSAAAPALQGSDTNTGINFGTDEVYINTDGSTQVTVNNAGEVMIGQTSKSNTTTGNRIEPGGRLVIVRGSSTTTETIQAFYRTDQGGSAIGTITTTDTATAFNTSSDYRLKENIVPLANAADRVKRLKPSQFNFKVDPTKIVDGFIAHEAQTVVPEAVTGTHDEVDDDGNPVYQVIDQSKIVPLLTAALQEALAKIETLETRLTALEGGAN